MPYDCAVRFRSCSPITLILARAENCLLCQESRNQRNSKAKMSTAEVIQCAQCTFTTLTQKGLTIHLRKMHNVQTHNRKPRRTQNRRQGIRLANCSMSAKSWGLPFVCVICGYRTAEKLVIKAHVEESEYIRCSNEHDRMFDARSRLIRFRFLSLVHIKEEELEYRPLSQDSGFGSAFGQAGTSQAYRDRRPVTPSRVRAITNCENVVVGYSWFVSSQLYLDNGRSFQHGYHSEPLSIDLSILTVNRKQLSTCRSQYDTSTPITQVSVFAHNMSCWRRRVRQSEAFSPDDVVSRETRKFSMQTVDESNNYN